MNTAPVAVAGTERPRLYYGWKVAISGAVILGMQTALVGQGFGAYAVVLQQQFGWSTTTMSVAYSMNRTESGLLGPIQGWVIGRYGPKTVLRFGTLLTLIGFVWFSRVSSQVPFILAYFVMSVGVGLAGFLTVTTETARWFRAKRSTALSLTSLGTAAGGIAAPALVWALDRFGWRATAVISGVVLTVLVLALAPLYGTTPEQRGEPIDGWARDAGVAESDPAPLPPGPQFTPRQTLRTAAFWYLAFGHATALLVVGSMIAHLPLYLTSEQGFSLSGAGWVVSALGVVQIGGMALGGRLGDRLDKRWLCSAAMVGHVAGLLLLAFATHRWMIWAFVLLHGIAWGMRAPLMVALRADYFGVHVLAHVQGYTSMILMFAMIGGPLFAGALADMTGSFRVGFTVLAALAATGCLLFILARPPRPPVVTEPEPEPVPA